MSVDDLIRAVREIDFALEQPGLEPDRKRDWRSQQDQVDALLQRFNTEVLAPLDQGVADGLREAERLGVRAKVGFLAAELAALASAAGRASGPDLIGRALELTARAPEIEIASVDFEGYVDVVHARWLIRHGQDRRAHRLLRSAEKRKTPGLSSVARETWNVPRPMGSSAPPLFRLNGFGLGLYGARDRREDGSHVATYCVSALWVPVFPLSAYRIRKLEGNRVSFGARARLSPFARAYQKLAALAAVAFIAVTGVDAYLKSPGREENAMIREAEEARTRGDFAAAEGQYEEIIQRFGSTMSSEKLENASAQLVNLWTDTRHVPEPVTPASVRGIEQVIDKYDRLPVSAKEGRPTDEMVEKLLAWADVLSSSPQPQAQPQAQAHSPSESLTQPAPSDSASASAGAEAEILRLLEHANRIAHGRREDVSSRYRSAVLAEAMRIAPSWPLTALSVLLPLGTDTKALAAEAPLVDEISEHAFLLLDAEPEMNDWLTRAKSTSTETERVVRVQTKQAEAKALEMSEDRQAALAEGSGPIFDKYLQSHPFDADFLLARARTLVEKGRLEAARDVLRAGASGVSGKLPVHAQVELAALSFQTGDLEAAEKIWENVLELRLPAFRAAEKEQMDAAAAVQAHEIDRLQKGTLPATVLADFDRAPENKRREVFGAYLRDVLAKDSRMKAAREASEHLTYVVSTAVSLGMVKLRRANNTTGDEQRALLDGAERAFFSVGDVADGLPQYHLGLGEVYHRLGRADEGEAEIGRVLALHDDDLSLTVAAAYRELGLPGRSREVAETLWSTGSEAVKQEAAFTISLLSHDLEERELWLKRSDTSSDAVKTLLRETKAYRLLRDGDLERADAAFAEVLKVYEARGTRTISDANNAALLEAQRYACTGDLAQLDRSVAHLEAAFRLAPQSSVVVGNLASALEQKGLVETLARWLDVSPLSLDASEAISLLSALRFGAAAPEVDRRMTDNASLRRSRELTAVEETLAPRGTEAYHRELVWYGLREDGDALRELLERLGRVGSLDVSQTERRLESLSDPATLRQYDQALAGGLKRLRSVAERSEARGQVRVAAAARFLEGTSLFKSGTFRKNVGDAEKAVEAFDRAKKLWPELNVAPWLLSSLLSVAVLHTAPDHPELARALEAMPPRQRMQMFLLELAQGDHGPELLKAIASQPEIARAVALRKTAKDGEPELSDWALAVVTGDEAFRPWAEAALARTDLRLDAEIEARFLVKDAHSVALAALYEAHAPLADRQ